jgi:hypothetical protein
MKIHILFVLILINFFNFINIKTAVSKNFLRPISSERPSKSDSSTTINKNIFQIESSLFSKTIDKKNSNKIARLNFFDFTMLRYGITDSFEIQYIDNFLLSSYKNHQTNINDQNIDSGDKFIRLKKNIFGNDNGKFGLSITGFNKIYTADNRLAKEALQSGMVIPFSFNISNRYSFGGMMQINYYRDNILIGKNNYFGFINSYYLSTSFNEKISSYIELYSLTLNNKKKIYKNYLDFGFNYIINDNFKIDSGINFGINKNADNLQYFSGFTARF